MLPFSLPVPSIVGMDSNPMGHAILQLLLTVPILIAGHSFYIKGFKTLIHGLPNMDTLVAIGTLAAFIYSVAMTLRIPIDPHAAHRLYYE